MLKSHKEHGDFVDHFRQQAMSLGYHYVLLDSRTGLTEVSGLCTTALADFVVILTGLNRQNLEGTKWVLNLLWQNPEAAPPLAVFSHVPDAEEELKKNRMEEAVAELGLDKSQQPIPLFYHPRMSLVEELFVKEWPQSRLAQSYVHLTDRLYQQNPEDLSQLIIRVRTNKRRQLRLRASSAGRNSLEELESDALRLYPNSRDMLVTLADTFADSAKGEFRGRTVVQDQGVFDPLKRAIDLAKKAVGYYKRALSASDSFEPVIQARLIQTTGYLGDRAGCPRVSSDSKRARRCFSRRSRNTN